MKLLNTIRYSEWWVYKLCPLLAIGYATILMGRTSFISASLFLAFLLFSIMNGAAYVCIINDLTDQKEDLLCGKPNRMAKVTGPLRWILPVACLVIGAPFLYLLYPDWLAMALYPLPCIAFSLYSFEPFRLKRRGFWGALADASGAHLFPSLYILSAMSYFTGQSVNWIWFSAVGIWALCYGLRGILWHQFRDRDNDRRVGLNTFATATDPRAFRDKGRLLFSMEILGLAIMLLEIGGGLCLVFLGLYFLLVTLRSRLLGQRIILIWAPEKAHFQILMMDYYQVFLPFALLFTAIMGASAALWVLVVHLLLFPQKTGAVFRDAIFSMRRFLWQRT
jgi:hypothetical protein